MANSLGVPLIGVQHHFAHAASLIAEHGLPYDQPIIACCFDGTGYGTDKNIWGGEFMIATVRDFDRIGHLKYFPLPGGDASIKKPYRTALSLLSANKLVWDKGLACVAACPQSERALLAQQFQKSIGSVSTSSMGRLFDAVASLIGVRQEITYEAQAAMELEALAADAIDDAPVQGYRFEWSRVSIEIDCQPLLKQICHDILTGVDRRRIAARFHHAIADMVIAVCTAARSTSGINKVGLTGGVFQNVLLLQLVKRRLNERSFEVLTHSIVPPNDGGLALGQAVVARNEMVTSQ